MRKNVYKKLWPEIERFNWCEMRSLYDCMHAKVNGDVIYCAKKAIKLDDTQSSNWRRSYQFKLSDVLILRPVRRDDPEEGEGVAQWKIDIL